LVYFDTAYIVKCYIKEPGWKEVRALAGQYRRTACSLYGRMELHAAFHRHFREQNITREQYTAVIEQFELDEKNHLWKWLPISEAVMETVTAAFKRMPPDIFLRTADALHLATAAVNAAQTCYSNDGRLLKAAAYFTVKAENIL
jgi:predicted nucleic acid-binding protein